MDTRAITQDEYVALRSHIEQLERDNSRLVIELSNARVPRQARTSDELERYVSDLLPLSMREQRVDVEDFGEGLVVTIEGVELDAYGHLVRSSIEFEVEGTITLPVRMTVRTTSEDEANDIAAELLREIADSIENPHVTEPNEVEDVEFDGFAAHSEVDQVREV